MIDNTRLMTQAALLRKRLNEDSSSPVDIFALAQNIEKLTLVFYPFGENLSGMCIKGQEGNCLIAVNSAMTQGRQRFSLAHEFYHLYYDDSMVSVCAKQLDSGIGIERSADMFASYFLMPDTALTELAEKYVSRNSGGPLELNDVIRIEQYFGVSHQAAVYRLMHTPFLNRERGEDYLTEAVRGRAEALGYSPALYRPLPEEKRYMTYGHYIDLARRLSAGGMISDGRYEELLLEAFRSDLVYGDDGEGDVID